MESSPESYHGSSRSAAFWPFCDTRLLQVQLLAQDVVSQGFQAAHVELYKLKLPFPCVKNY
jgi:hypothetical protein